MAQNQDKIIITSLAMRNLALLGYDLETSGAYMLLSIDAAMHGDNVFDERRASVVLGTHTNKIRKIFRALEDRIIQIDDRHFELKPLEGLE